MTAEITFHQCCLSSRATEYSLNSQKPKQKNQTCTGHLDGGFLVHTNPSWQHHRLGNSFPWKQLWQNINREGWKFRMRMRGASVPPGLELWTLPMESITAALEGTALQHSGRAGDVHTCLQLSAPICPVPWAVLTHLIPTHVLVGEMQEVQCALRWSQCSSPALQTSTEDKRGHHFLLYSPLWRCSLKKNIHWTKILPWIAKKYSVSCSFLLHGLRISYSHHLSTPVPGLTDQMSLTALSFSLFSDASLPLPQVAHRHSHLAALNTALFRSNHSAFFSSESGLSSWQKGEQHCPPAHEQPAGR